MKLQRSATNQSLDTGFFLLDNVIGCNFLAQVYCDKTAKARMMQFSLKCSSMFQLCDCHVLLRNSKEIPMIGGSY